MVLFCHILCSFTFLLLFHPLLLDPLAAHLLGFFYWNSPEFSKSTTHNFGHHFQLCCLCPSVKVIFEPSHSIDTNRILRNKLQSDSTSYICKHLTENKCIWKCSHYYFNRKVNRPISKFHKVQWNQESTDLFWWSWFRDKYWLGRISFTSLNNESGKAASTRTNILGNDLISHIQSLNQCWTCSWCIEMLAKIMCWDQVLSVTFKNIFMECVCMGVDH